VEVTGRVLPKEKINFGDQPPMTAEVPDDKADWTNAFRSKIL